MAGSGPRTALPHFDAASGAGVPARAPADAGLDIFAAAPPPPPAVSTEPVAPPLLGPASPDPTLGGRRRPVGVRSAAAAADAASAVPIRTVLGTRAREPRPAVLRLRRQAGVAALTLVTAAAGLGSAWTVRAVFAHVPKTHAPAVWGVETQGTPQKVAKVVPAEPSPSATASHRAAGDRHRSVVVAAGDNRGPGSASSGSSGSGSGSSGHHKGDDSGKGTRASAGSDTEVHHRKGRDGDGGGGADDPATHDATPDAEDGGHKGGGGDGATSAPSAPTSEPSPTSTLDDSSGGSGGSGGSGSGSSGGGGGGGGGHDDFVAGG